MPNQHEEHAPLCNVLTVLSELCVLWHSQVFCEVGWALCESV